MYFLGIASITDAAVAGMFLLSATIISGTFLYFSNRNKNGNGNKAAVVDPDMTKIGDAPIEVVNRRFEVLERMHLWTLFVLVGQGFGFLMFALHIWQELLKHAHRINDRLDLMQIDINRDRRTR